jgi:muramoyltetrapeptide carboxypeptidase
MIKHPPHLKKGDKVAIVCPAKQLPQPIDSAIKILEAWGLTVIVGETVNTAYHQFAGTDESRTQDLQKYLDDSDVKAVIAGRGGYGTIRIIDDLDFTAFLKSPKWIVGFSDITVLLSHIYAQFGLPSIHAQMPYTFDESTPEALESLKNALFGERISYQYESTFNNRPGQAEGILIGGNLSLLMALEGSASEVDFTDKILFLEEVGEHEYAVDRMLRSFYRKGKLAKLKGLIIGAFNGMTPELIPFGQTPEQVIWEIVKAYDYPVCFNFPTGHINNNMAMIVGNKISLAVETSKTTLKFLS